MKTDVKLGSFGSVVSAFGGLCTILVAELSLERRQN
jgi:hypothetical protein